jgi:phosphotriesterase-related protein
MVNTVTGPVSSDDLGGVLCHEHVVFGYPGTEIDASFDVWDYDKFFSVIDPVIQTIKGHGYRTIVDATANDCGRRVDILKRVSEECDINIICSTGCYYEHGGAPAYWRVRKAFFDVPEEIYRLFTRELNEGVGTTGIKAGAIKIGTGIGEISEYERMMFEVAARVANEDPNARIITHCSHGTMLREQAELFLELGVNPRQVQLGHFCDTVDLSTQLDVLGMGFYAGFDRLGQVGFDGMPYDDDRLAAICALTASGFGDRIMLSNDRLYWFFGREWNFPQESWDAMLGEWHWTYIPEKIMPKLRGMGLSEAQVHAFVFENPVRFYGGD